LATVVGVFFLYSLAALLGLGRGLLFPSSASLGERLPSLRVVARGLKAASAPCGTRGPLVRREAEAQNGVQSVVVDVTDHFSPNVIIARRHIPLRMYFRRQSSNPCSELLEIPGFHVRRPLRHEETTSIVIFPTRAGRYVFSCERGMMTGIILVR